MTSLRQLNEGGADWSQQSCVATVTPPGPFEGNVDHCEYHRPSPGESLEALSSRELYIATALQYWCGSIQTNSFVEQIVTVCQAGSR